MLRTYPEAHIKTHIYVCAYETHINGNPLDYERSADNSNEPVATYSSDEPVATYNSSVREAPGRKDK